MSVYVDDMCDYAMGQFRRMKMSHMIADTDEELHAMADHIGVARKWHQGDHYDVSMSKRALAIQAGACPIPLRTLSMMSMSRRFGYGLPRPEYAKAMFELRMALRA